MGTLSSNQLKVGLTIELDGAPYVVVSVDHVKPGKGAAFARTKLKSIKTELVIDRTFRGDDKLRDAYIETRNLQYSYHSGNFYHFLDTQTYEDIAIEIDKLHATEKFLIDDLVVDALYYDKKLIAVNLPYFVVYTIAHTEPGIRGDTSKAGTKPATLDGGAVIQVPLFVDVGTRVRVDTRTGTYIERSA